MQREAEQYFKRFGFCEKKLSSTPPPDLGIVVVIPCFQEDDLIGSLESLRAGDFPACSTEIIVVINSSPKSPPDARRQNQRTWETFQQWNTRPQPSGITFHGMNMDNLPHKHAGVGLARKIGMDEALRRFAAVHRMDGVIVGFDADCRCDVHYLQAIERHFADHRDTPGCSIYFEHPLKGPDEPAVYQAVAAYELHLRYFVRGLRHAHLPYAYHTVGSSMAVRASAYMKQGGMNRRQAGEDFYFLHKIIALGGFTELQSTRVIPSPRPSHRVPFGTGKAVRAILDAGHWPTYPTQAFEDLKSLSDWARQGCPHMQLDENTSPLSEVLREFLALQGFAEALPEMKRNTSSQATLEKRFFRWFDAFKAMKFIHFARDHAYGSPDITEAARHWLRILRPEKVKAIGSTTEPQELLDWYRRWDRTGTI